MDKIREEAEEYIDNYLDMGCFKDPDKWRPALIEGYEFGYKSHDEEIKKFEEIKRINEDRISILVKYNYRLIDLLKEVSDLDDIDYLIPSLRDRIKEGMRDDNSSRAKLYTEAEIKKLRDALNEACGHLDRYTIAYPPEWKALKDGE